MRICLCQRALLCKGQVSDKQYSLSESNRVVEEFFISIGIILNILIMMLGLAPGAWLTM